MKPDKMRVEIAKACGWRKDQSCSAPWCWWTPEGKLSRQEGMPDYTGDLNAMHEAEKILDVRQQDVFAGFLASIVSCGHTDYGAMKVMATTKILFATAAQRSEALLRAIEKWESSPTTQPPTNKQPSTTTP